jgi:pimeloyl-ACP methyl ester carboxylesterase
MVRLFILLVTVAALSAPVVAEEDVWSDMVSEEEEFDVQRVLATDGGSQGSAAAATVWTPCLIAGGRLPASLLQCGAAPPLVECASVPVPLNYSAPAGSETINISTLRIRSSSSSSSAETAKRRGSVWVACGGPGAAQQPEVYGVLYKFLGCAFDLYFADYRGVGQSANLGSAGCVNAATGLDFASCAASANATWGAKLHHFTVTNIARDFDRLIPMFQQQPQEATVVFGYSWGTYVANRLLQVMASHVPVRPVYLTGVVMDAVCTPGLCKATNIGVNQDQCGRMLLGRYCARDAMCAAKLGGDPEHFAARVFDSLDAGGLPCATALKLQKWELQTLLNGFAGAHWPVMKLPFAPALLYRLRRCSAPDLAALNHSITQARAARAAGVPLPLGASIIQEVNVEYGDMWRASLGGSAGEALIPSQAVLDAQYERFMFADNNADFNGFNGKTVRVGYDLWNKFKPDEFVGRFAPPLVPLLLLNGDTDQAVDNDANAQQSARFYDSKLEGARANLRLLTIPYAGHTTLGQSPVRCSEQGNPLACTVAADGVGINGPLAPACGAQIAASFINDTSGPLDVSCLQRLFPLDLEGKLSLTQRWSEAEFGTPDMWGDGLPTPAPTPPPTPTPPPLPYDCDKTSYTCAPKAGGAFTTQSTCMANCIKHAPTPAPAPGPTAAGHSSAGAGIGAGLAVVAVAGAVVYMRNRHQAALETGAAPEIEMMQQNPGVAEEAPVTAVDDLGAL